jgi:hypothetical protein
MEQKLLNTLKSEHASLKSRINALKEEMQENSKVLMKEAFREFLEKYDVVENIFWTQYTPYFNDGESCEFSVGDVYLVLKDDEDACEYEGSTLTNKDDIASLKKTIAEIEAWEKDPMAAAEKRRSEYIKQYNRDPFSPSNYSGSTQDQMAKWQPHYGTKEQYIKQLATAEEFAKLYPNMKSDFKEIQSMVSSIDEDLMKAMFGDHAKVVVSTTGIEIEEHQHD